jgi:hypothetical protein
VTVLGARRRGHHQRRIRGPQVVAVQRQHVGQNQFAGVALAAVLMLFDVEADGVPTFSQEPGAPAAQAATEINDYRLAHIVWRAGDKPNAQALQQSPWHRGGRFHAS